MILVSPRVEKKGSELGDLYISLSVKYQRALTQAGGVPLAMPATISPASLPSAWAAATGSCSPGARTLTRAFTPMDRLRACADGDGDPRRRPTDLRELMLIDEVFRQRKPLLAICRGHQVLNVLWAARWC